MWPGIQADHQKGCKLPGSRRRQHAVMNSLILPLHCSRDGCGDFAENGHEQLDGTYK